MTHLQVAPGDPTSLSPAWDSLAERSSNIFSTREWGATWRRHFRAGRQAPVVVRQGGEEPIAILPFERRSVGPLKVVRFTGHGPADELGPICDPAHRVEIAAVIPSALRELHPSHDLFIGDLMAGDIDWADPMGGRLLNSEGSPTIKLSGRSWDDYLADRSRNFRGQVRARERKVMKLPSARFRAVSEPEELPKALDDLFRLHRATWTSATEFSRAEPFHRAFAKVAQERGWLRLWVLEVEGATVATWYGFRFGSAVSFYQQGRDARWQRRSVGSVLLGRTIRAAMDEGAAEYRLLRGDESYKARWADDDPGLATIGRAGSALGAAVLRSHAVTSRLAHAVDMARIALARRREHAKNPNPEKHA